jgi:nucleotide-binding universal stress UspA family protein
MHALQRILIGHDFRPGGATAVQSALALAQRTGGCLKLVHVLEPYPVYQQLVRPLTAPYSTAELAERAGRYLQSLASELEHEVTRVEYEVRSGTPFVELIVARRAWQADLLVVGGSAAEHGRLLGGTSEHVVRKALVPVLVAKRRLPTAPQRIMVPIDFSPNAKAAAIEALTLTRHFDAQLLFVHVIGLPAAYAFGYGPPLAPLPPVPLPTPAELAPEWDAFLADLPDATQRNLEILTREGAPVPTLLEVAGDHNVGLIVMGTHGRTGIPHMLLGSVAEGVVRGASCPVLTLRPEALPFELP